MAPGANSPTPIQGSVPNPREPARRLGSCSSLASGAPSAHTGAGRTDGRVPKRTRFGHALRELLASLSRRKHHGRERMRAASAGHAPDTGAEARPSPRGSAAASPRSRAGRSGLHRGLSVPFPASVPTTLPGTQRHPLALPNGTRTGRDEWAVHGSLSCWSAADWRVLLPRHVAQPGRKSATALRLPTFRTQRKPSPGTLYVWMAAPRNQDNMPRLLRFQPPPRTTWSSFPSGPESGST